MIVAAHVVGDHRVAVGSSPPGPDEHAPQLGFSPAANQTHRHRGVDIAADGSCGPGPPTVQPTEPPHPAARAQNLSNLAHGQQRFVDPSNTTRVYQLPSTVLCPPGSVAGTQRGRGYLYSECWQVCRDRCPVGRLGRHRCRGCRYRPRLGPVKSFLPARHALGSG